MNVEHLLQDIGDMAGFLNQSDMKSAEVIVTTDIDHQQVRQYHIEVSYCNADGTMTEINEGSITLTGILLSIHEKLATDMQAVIDKSRKISQTGHELLTNLKHRTANHQILANELHLDALDFGCDFYNQVV